MGMPLGLVGEQSARAKSNWDIPEGVCQKRRHGANGAANPTNLAMYSSLMLVNVLPSVFTVLEGHSAARISCFVHRYYTVTGKFHRLDTPDVTHTWYNVSDACIHAWWPSVVACWWSCSTSVECRDDY